MKSHVKKILFLVVLHLAGISAEAQVKDSSGVQLLLGARIRPFAFNYNITAATEFLFQVNLSKNISPVIKFGYANYNVDVLSLGKVNYNIKAVFVKPGITFYLKKREYLVRPYITLSASMCDLQHEMTYTINDVNWGTSVNQFYNLQTVWSLEAEFGCLLSITKRIKGISGIAVANKIGNNNPFPQIKDFDNATSFTPGTGYGRELSFDLFMGVVFVIY